jgi:hypothetical protein
MIILSQINSVQLHYFISPRKILMYYLRLYLVPSNDFSSEILGKKFHSFSPLLPVTDVPSKTPYDDGDDNNLFQIPSILRGDNHSIMGC